LAGCVKDSTAMAGCTRRARLAAGTTRSRRVTGAQDHRRSGSQAPRITGTEEAAKMASKTTFTAEEWNRILESVMLSGMAVTAADPSGLIGVLRESMATGRTLLAAKADPTSNELIKSVVSDFKSNRVSKESRSAT
jgi:hypothetical protein